MAKKTYEEFVEQSNPELAVKAEYYAALGVSRPILWAQSEAKNEPAIASSLFAYALRCEVNKPDDHGWSDAIKVGAINIENRTLLAEAADALRYAEACGIDLTRLTPVIRAIQSQCIKNFASILDEGPELLCLPLPPGRETSWQLYEEKNGNIIGKPISGLRELINDPDEI